MKKRIFTAIAAAVILCGCGGNNNASAKTEADILRERLTASGIAASECDYSAEDNVLSVTVISKSAGDTVSAEDITALRRVRNILRYDLNKLSIVSSSAYNEVLKNSYGDTLSDSDINITGLPGFEECKKLLENAETENKSPLPENMFEGLSVIACECRYEPHIGNTLFLTVNTDGKAYPQVSEDIANIISAVDIYNKDNCSVQQLVLQALDNGRQIFYMEADLVYRDFLWWQAPEMEDSRQSGEFIPTLSSAPF